MIIHVEDENIVCLDKMVDHDIIAFSGSQLGPVTLHVKC